MYIIYMNNNELTGLEKTPSFQSLDYINSDDPKEIDAGIRETIRSIHFSILGMGLGLVKIKIMRLYKDLGYQSMGEYIASISKESKMDRSNIYRWLKIGEAYIKYKAELTESGFSESHGPIKLSFLEQALTTGKKDEVFDNIKNMSVREFKDFAKGGGTPNSGNLPFVSIKGNVAYIRGKRAIIVNKNLGKRITDYFMEVVGVACEALEKGGYIMPVFLRSKNETERFSAAYDRVMEEMKNGN